MVSEDSKFASACSTLTCQHKHRSGVGAHTSVAKHSKATVALSFNGYIIGL